MGSGSLNEFERFENMIDHLPVDRPPVVCPMHAGTTALMKAATAYYPMVQDDPIKMARLAMAGHDMTGFENVTVPFDDSVEVSAFGIKTGLKGAQRLPLILQHRISKPEDVDKLQVPDPRYEGKVPIVLRAVRLLEDERNDVPIFLSIISPLTLAMQLRGTHEMLLDMVNDPVLSRKLLDKTTEFILEYVREAAKNGLDQIVINDPVSNSDVLTLDQFKEFSEPYGDRVANEMGKMDIESILHVCGRVTEPELERLIEIDVDALSIDEQVPIPMAKRIGARRHMVIIGNVSPTKTLLMGNPQSIEEATKHCIDEGVDAVAPGCSLETYTPLENLITMTSVAKRYGAEHAARKGR